MRCSGEELLDDVRWLQLAYGPYVLCHCSVIVLYKIQKAREG